MPHTDTESAILLCELCEPEVATCALKGGELTY